MERPSTQGKYDKAIEKIDWSDELSIGNINIDKDHKKLIDILNELIDICQTDKNWTKFAKVLSDMTDYSLIHFKKEEDYMEQFFYQGYASHKKMHMEYIYKVAMFNMNFSRVKSSNPEEVVTFLHNWWLNHILKSDFDYEAARRNQNLSASYF